MVYVPTWIVWMMLVAWSLIGFWLLCRGLDIQHWVSDILWERRHRKRGKHSL